MPIIIPLPRLCNRIQFVWIKRKIVSYNQPANTLVERFYGISVDKNFRKIEVALIVFFFATSYAC
jgi:hypothetical protein